MKISQREVRGIVVVELKGQLTMGEGDVELRDAIHKLAEGGAKSILIDLGKVTYMDSAGLGELIRCYTTVSNRQGKLKLLNLTRKIKDLLTITKLITVFDSYEDEKEALASFQEG
mgnify:CR=1 FL=1